MCLGAVEMYLYMIDGLIHLQIQIKHEFVATANLTTTFVTICSFSPPVKDEERSQRQYPL